MSTSGDDGRGISRRALIVGGAGLTVLGGCRAGTLSGWLSPDGGGGAPDGGAGEGGFQPVDTGPAPPNPDGGPPPADSQAPAADTEPPPPPSLQGRVADIHDPLVAPDVNQPLDGSRMAGVLSAALRTLTGRQDLGQAWRAILPDFAASMRIGIKVNTINSSMANAPPFLKALVTSLIDDLGADPSRIRVWDRTSNELQSAGITESAVGVAVAGTDGDHDATIQVNGTDTRLSRIQTTLTDITINVGVLKDHNQSGMTGALKNIYGSINNPGSFHDINQRLVPLFSLDDFRQRSRLFINEGFKAIFAGGPGGAPQAAPGRLLMSVDPLAIDVQALAIINSLRTSPVDSGDLAWMDDAETAGLGTKSPQVIKQTI